MLVGATDASSGANAGEIRNLSMRAQALLASGLVRISQHPKAVEPGFSALALAETGGAPDVVAAMRIDLAACAQQVGEPLLGGALLRPVLEAAQTPPAVRAAALGRLVGCVAHVSRRDDVEDALSEADRLLAADSGIGADVRRMERARLAVRTAGYHRWYGDTEDAITAAREGLNLLTRLRDDLRSESDRLRARLVLELVCGLLDEGELREAEAAAHPTVDEPVRATSAASVGRLMLAVATRLYLPSGQLDRGRHLLDQAAWLAERHSLDGLRADALTEVSRLDEQAGRAGDALEAMRAARAAEHRRMRAVSRAARIVLVEVGAGHGIRDTAQQSVSALMRQLAHPAGLPVAVAPPQQVAAAQQQQTVEPLPQSGAPELAGTVDMEQRNGNGLLDREGLLRRMRSVRNERPVALTLVRVEPNKETDRGPDTGIMTGLADKVRNMAPENAELARSDGSELAVLLPAATRDQAEEFAATIRQSDWPDATGKDMSISTGVVHTDHTTTDDEAGILTAARDAMTPAQANSLTETAAALQSALSEETPTKPLNNPNSPNNPNNAGPATPGEHEGRSILSSLSIPTGSGGRRRAGEEQPPGAKSRWPAEPAEAPRWTRAERRAQAAAENPPTDPAENPATPAEPAANGPLPTEEPSQGKRAATPARPSFSESRIGEATTAIDRTHLQSRHGTPSAPAAEPGQTTRRIPTPAEPQPTTTAGQQSPAALSQPTATATGTQAAHDAASVSHRTGTGVANSGAATASPAGRGSDQAGADTLDAPAAVDSPAGRHGNQADLLDGRAAAASSAGRHGNQADPLGGQAAADASAGRRSNLAGIDVPDGQAAAASLAGRHGDQPDPLEGRVAAASLTGRRSNLAGIDVPDGQAAAASLAGRHGDQPDPLEGRVAAASLTGRRSNLAGIDVPDGQVAAASSAGRHGDPSGADAPDGRVSVGRRGDWAGADVPVGAAVGRRVAAASLSPANSEESGARAGHDASATGSTSLAPADASGNQAVHDGPSVSADSGTSQVASRNSGAGAVGEAPDVSARRHVTLDAVGSLADRSGSKDTRSGAGGLTSGTEEAGLVSSFAGLSSGGILRGASGADRAADSKRSSYEETKAELAKMMSALNAKSLAARERNGARQTIPTPPAPDDIPEPPSRPDVPEPPDPDPIPPVPSPITPDPAPPLSDRISLGPDSIPAFPDRNLSSPDRVPFVPDSNPAGPNRNPLVPDSNPAGPDRNPAFPDRNPLVPDSIPAGPDRILSDPDRNPAGPDRILSVSDRFPSILDPVSSNPVPQVPDPVSQVSDRLPSGPPPSSEPEVGGRSRLMAAFDALTGPVPGLRADFDDAVELPARKPAESWAEIETAAVVESPADALFGSEPTDAGAPRSSLGAAFAEFDSVEKKVTEPVKETVQETSYEQPIGPERRPAGLPRRGEKSSATIASLLTEAMAAYQSTAEDSEIRQVADRFDAYAVDDAERPPPGVRGRHRSPE
jgi:hypothetical protein